MNKIEVDSGKMEMLSRELGKLQCWLTGYHAGMGHKPFQVGIGIPGEDAVRQAKLLFRDMVQASVAPAVTPETSVADAEGWIAHDGKGMPVSGETYVATAFRDGTKDPCKLAGFWANGSENWWFHRNCDYDILAYKIAE